MYIKFFFIKLLLLFTLNNFLFSFQSNPIFITKSADYHIVRRGDTLSSIARQYSLSVDRIKLYNNLESDRIFEGQKIYLNPNHNERTEFVTQRPIPQRGYHIVSRGETVYRISKMYDVEIIDLIEYNNLSSFTIYENQKIWLVAKEQTIAVDKPQTVVKPDQSEPQREEEAIVKPTEKITYHIVRRGENLYRIAQQYGMTVKELKNVNRLDSDIIYVGQRLIVAEGKITDRPPAAFQTVDAEETRTKIHTPLRGRVVSEFGIRNNIPHNGIDIAAPIGDPIHAALDGKVVFSGTQRGYGNVIVLEHSDFIMTVYAHNERNLVRLGEQVRAGQPIATVGQSGNATGPHLHFEYRIRGKAIDPRLVLTDLD